MKAHAINQGIDAAKGRFLVFLDQDDVVSTARSPPRRRHWGSSTPRGGQGRCRVAQSTCPQRRIEGQPPESAYWSEIVVTIVGSFDAP